MESSPIKLSELTQYIHKVFSGSFAGKYYWVLADVSNHSYQQNKGYHYFDLVEKEDAGIALKARVNATAWQEGSLKIQEFEKSTGQKFQNDIRILALVSVEFHSVYGLKLSLLDLDIHYTLGALEQQRQNTLIRLLRECSDFIQKDGDRFITRNKQWSLPKVIQKIAVISSKSSAGFQDFEHTLTNNSYGYTFFLDPYFTQVQGESNAEGIRDILLNIFHSQIAYDAVFLLRGGGANTDFLIFDTFILAQIVAKFPIPIITGIGHQKNETLVDLMAHTATKTPTQAAEFILAHNRGFEINLLQIRQGIAIRTQKFLAFRQKELNTTQISLVNRSRNWIQSLNTRLVEYRHGISRNTQNLIFQYKQELRHEANRLANLPIRFMLEQRSNLEELKFISKSALKNTFHRQNQELDYLKNLLKIISPENILKRGFALVKKEGIIQKDIKELFPGDSIEIILYEGEILTTIHEKRKRTQPDL